MTLDKQVAEFMKAHAKYYSTDGVMMDAATVHELVRRSLSSTRTEELLKRAVAYLPVPATIMRDGTEVGVKVPNVHEQPAVNALRKEILDYFRNATGRCSVER